MFERLFLGSLALSVISFFMSYESMTRQIENEAALAELGIGGGIVIGSFLFSMAVYLLLWFLIARKGVGLAKWVLVVLLALSLISVPGMLAAINIVNIIGLIVYALEVAAVIFLFKDDARAWFQGGEPANPDTFD
ncbi:Ca2+/Na+ antiporter [Altererythrobacter atlanticus]|nr:Ca2+/Na+ antiporter [Croceibacterium atlanticum]